MKIAYFDCFSGASGDMILGALVDAGLPIETLRAQLEKLHLSGFSIRSEKVSKKGISGTRVIVEAEDSSTHRHLPKIIEIINCSTLDDSIKHTAIDVFENLARAEAKIHNTTVEKIHFHEVGAIDAIVDIVGAAIGLHELGIEKVFSSRIHVGSGFVECQHGRMPLPAPATLELLRGVPIYCEGIEAELITPTGAAILKTVSSKFGPPPDMTLAISGYGAGTRDLPIPNLLRLWIGQSATSPENKDEIILVETNVDNMNPELLAHAAESLWGEGVLDIYFTPIIMKKNRPATKLSLLITPDSFESVVSRLFTEVSTLGIRYQRMSRTVLQREVISVKTEYGTVEVKIGRYSDEVCTVNPEYDSCSKVAKQSAVPVRDVYDAARATAREVLRSKNN